MWKNYQKNKVIHRKMANKMSSSLIYGFAVFYAEADGGS